MEVVVNLDLLTVHPRTTEKDYSMHDNSTQLVSCLHLDERRPKRKRTAALMSFDIGIAEGGARTHDLEVDLFAVIRATRSTN